MVNAEMLCYRFFTKLAPIIIQLISAEILILKSCLKKWIFKSISKRKNNKNVELIAKDGNSLIKLTYLYPTFIALILQKCCKN